MAKPEVQALMHNQQKDAVEARYAALFDNFPLDRMWRLLGVETVLTWRQGIFVPSDLLKLPLIRQCLCR